MDKDMQIFSMHIVNFIYVILLIISTLTPGYFLLHNTQKNISHVRLCSLNPLFHLRIPPFVYDLKTIEQSGG